MTRIDIGIDLGTSNTVIYIRDKGVVVNQPSVVAYRTKDKQVIAIGNKAKRMIGKTPEGIEVIRPIFKGAISDYTRTERMVKAYVQNAISQRKIWGRPNICVSVPSDTSEVQVRAVEEAIYRTGAKNVYVIEEPFAAALGVGVDIDSSRGNMIVDIGGGTTDVAVTSKGDIAFSKSIKIGGNDFDSAIIKYLKNRHNIFLGDTLAEELKLEIGSVYSRQEDAVGYAKGKEMVRGLPTKMPVKSSEIIFACQEVVNQIINLIKNALESVTPEILADIHERGIILTGGGSKIYGMEKLIYDETGVKAKLAENPELAVATGAGVAKKYIRDNTFSED